MEVLVKHAENKNIDTIQMLVNAYWEEYSPYVDSLQEKQSQELRQNSVVREFDKMIRFQLDKLNVHLVSVLSLDGTTVFSTNPRKLAAKSTSDRYLKALKKQKPVSFVGFYDLVTSMEELKVHRYVVTSYIPVFEKGKSQLQAIFEIHLDVTDVVNGFNSKASLNYLAIGALILGFIVVLFLMVRRVELIVNKQDDEVKKLRKIIERQSNHDALTGLPNRIMLRDRLDHGMKQCHLENKLLALLFIDLDYFQKVNDALGYSTGDQLLVEVSRRIQQCVRPGDTVARIGGDEFVVIAQSISVFDEAEDVARHMLKSASEDYHIDGHELFMSLSIGIAMYPFSEENVNSLLKKAHSAMNKAKLAGRNTVRYFTDSAKKQSASRFYTENSLRRALERNEFELHYQPIVQTSTGRIVSVEALLRWQSPDHGSISPVQFIPLLEETGLIIPVGQWVLENACKQGVLWNNGGLNDLKISVNMSAKLLLNQDLIKQVNDVLDMSGLRPHLLDLEITESLLIEDFTNTIKILENLSDIGISLSIDDFGTGYSSLSYLKRMPVDTLKIDQSFVRDIAVNIDDAAIVEAICALASSLRFKITAEGVENMAQLDCLRRAGVNLVQGFLFSKPLPASEIEPLLRQKKILLSSESAA